MIVRLRDPSERSSFGMTGWDDRLANAGRPIGQSLAASRLGGVHRQILPAEPGDGVLVAGQFRRHAAVVLFQAVFLARLVLPGPDDELAAELDDQPAVFTAEAGGRDDLDADGLDRPAADLARPGFARLGAFGRVARHVPPSSGARPPWRPPTR